MVAQSVSGGVITDKNLVKFGSYIKKVSWEQSSRGLQRISALLIDRGGILNVEPVVIIGLNSNLKVLKVIIVSGY